MHKQFIRIFLLLIFLGTQEHQAQDSLKYNDNLQSDWEIGFLLGGSYPFFVGSNKDLISNEGGFAFSADVVYKNIFLRGGISGMNATVENSFTLTEEWSQNLPLDATQFLFSIGYRIITFDHIYIKPMFSLMQLNYTTDDRVREYTGIERSINLSYYGFGFSIAYNVLSTFSPISSIELEVGINYFEPFNSTMEKNFTANVLNLSFGILIFSQIK